MTYADCVPILLLDPVRRVIGLVHAGWRGTALRIASKTVAAMRHHFGCRPEHVIAAIGPSIGQCCYPVSGEVSAAFRAAYGDTAEEFHTGAHLDLWSANRYDLESEGVPCHQIENPELCTACNTHTFFSHRAEDGATGRMGACMGLVA
jgi:YfiH family protein